MKLIECYIEKFGKICQQKFTFNDGFNCICQDNGEGKTTLSVFIKVMLYGMSDTKRAVSENERKRYMPWSGGICSGYLVIEAGGVTYRIERSFADKSAQDTCRVFDVATGLECDGFDDGFGNVIFGIDADAFERTVFHSEKNLSASNNNQTISAKLSNLVGCDGDIGGVDDALKKLDERRKFLQKARGGGGHIAELRAEVSSLEEQIADMARIESELSELEEKNEDLLAKMQSLTDRADELTRERGRALLHGTRKESAKRAAAIRERLAELTSQRNKIVNLLGGSVPTVEDIEKANMYRLRAEQMHESIKERTTPTEEYSALSAKFDGLVTPEQINEIKRARESVRRKDAQLLAERSSRFGQVFAKRTPTRDEIARTIELCNKKTATGVSPLPTVMLVVAIGCAIAGFALNPRLYAVAAVAAAIAIILFVSASSKAKAAEAANNEEIARFFLSVSGNEPNSDERLSLLYEMQALISGAVIDDVAREREQLSDFAKKFGDGYDVDSILADYDRYDRLRMKMSVIEESVRGERSEADRLLLVSRAFATKYKALGENPFDALREYVKQYTEISSAIREAEAELSALGDGTDANDDAQNLRSVEEIDAQMREDAQYRAELERIYGANVRRCAECEHLLLEKDALASRLVQSKESYEQAQNQFEIIKLTQQYLTEARDAMNARYLGRTKESFARYVEIISGISDEVFTMDTTFEITKLDAGNSRVTDSYSRGTRELYNVAARMAVCDSLYDGELPFIIFDDPFVALDDAKIERALALLTEIARERQIIYFTCSRSRATLS